MKKGKAGVTQTAALGTEQQHGRRWREITCGVCRLRHLQASAPKQHFELDGPLRLALGVPTTDLLVRSPTVRPQVKRYLERCKTREMRTRDAG